MGTGKAKIVEIRWTAPGTDNYPATACSGESTTKSSKRVLKCSRPATVWRSLILTDGTEIPKPLCEVHREAERKKWEAVMTKMAQPAPEVVAPSPAPTKPSSRRPPKPKPTSARRTKVVTALCLTCGNPVADGDPDYCEKHHE